MSQTPTLYRLVKVIEDGPFAKATLYRLIRKGRVSVEHVGARMAFTRETGNEIAIRIAREDAERRADDSRGASSRRASRREVA